MIALSYLSIKHVTGHRNPTVPTLEDRARAYRTFALAPMGNNYAWEHVKRQGYDPGTPPEVISNYADRRGI